jgi:hypothetical protein
MMDLSGVIAAAVLLLLLMALAIKGWLTSRQLQEPALPSVAEDGPSLCPEEFVSRVFSRDDWEFVHGLKAGEIERLFQRERKNVALVWVRQTSAVIRKLMREHASAARQSKNLEFSVEVSILSQFLLSIAACGILSIAIQLGGPLFWGGLARFAQKLSQRIVKVHEAFQAGTLANTADGSV